ncbi:hypothetical protein DLK05_03315 [Ancylomarina longa]|uniref:Uncharacterized protein n=1 Tax=Ancylomarina longa TaxID=2487017 RepID=A0A434AXH9_9BACT|nr:hypothetical protein DLK05_03315 [Ancylomarina longa]
MCIESKNMKFSGTCKTSVVGYEKQLILNNDSLCDSLFQSLKISASSIPNRNLLLFCCKRNNNEYTGNY